jgi:hypothetical protein
MGLIPRNLSLTVSAVERRRLGWKVARVSRPVAKGITGRETRATKRAMWSARQGSRVLDRLQAGSYKKARQLRERSGGMAVSAFAEGYGLARAPALQGSRSQAGNPRD